jgi:hypothetical protein
VAKDVPADANKRLAGQLEKMLSDLSVKNRLQREARANALKALGELARINAVSFPWGAMSWHRCWWW